MLQPLHRSVTVRAFLCAILLAAATVPARALPILDKLDSVLRNLLEDPLAGLSRARVIVSATPGSFSSLLLTLRLGGYTILAEHPLIEAVTIEAPRLALTALSTLNLVSSLSVDAPTRALSDDVSTTGERLLGTLGLRGSAYTGNGFGVAVVDSGIAPAPVFGSRITAFYDFTTTGKAVAKLPYDDYGHGTHVAGLIGGSASPSNETYAGIAPGVSLIGLKVLNGDGGGLTSAVISAIEFATKNRTALGIQVINLSLGHPIYERAATDPLVRAVELAVRRGLVVVASAGNYGTNSATGELAYGGITSPGNAPAAITVGALNARDSITREDDILAAYSSRGPTWFDGFSKPDVVAPGHALAAAVPTSRLWSAYPSLRAESAGPGQYMRLSGTSMAAAVTSGVVSLVLEAHRTSAPSQPALTSNAVKAVLQFTALPLPTTAGSATPDDQLAYGAGGINAAGATELASRIDTTARVGNGWLTSGVSPTTTIDNQHLSWGQQLVWNSHVVWGDSVYSNQPAFGLGISWDSHVVWGDHVVWGENTVWWSPETWGSHVVWGDTWIGRTEGEHVVWGDGSFTQQTVAWGNLATSPSKPANTLTDPSAQP
ncbi:MAG: S8 family peptidase [Vicinamibacterales bacterium]